MPVVPIAAFLAGALLTWLLPVVLLTALAIWYTLLLERAPDPAVGPEPATSGLDAATTASPEAGGTRNEV